MKTKPILGTVSSGTMREEDLIPAFLDALDELDADKASAIREEHADTLAILDKDSDEWTDEDIESLSCFLNETLFDALQDCALPYFYFGSHPGDGCDYGFWLTEDLNQQVVDGGGLVVSDLSEVPKTYPPFAGEVLHVNDHGNATLYFASHGRLTEIWSVV